MLVKHKSVSSQFSMQVFAVLFKKLRICSLHALINMAKLIYTWFCKRIEELDDPDAHKQFADWLASPKHLSRRSLARQFRKQDGHSNVYISGDDAEALFKFFASAEQHVFAGRFEYVVCRDGVDIVYDFAHFIRIVADMRKLLGVLYIWDASDPAEHERVEWATKNYAKVAGDFREFIANGRDTNYLHILERHVSDILAEGSPYPFAADAQESIQSKFKKAKARHSNQGGGKSTAQSKWDWIRSILIRHIIKQDVQLNDPSCTPKSLLQRVAKRAENGVGEDVQN